MNLNIRGVDPNAVQYIVDLIEQDMNRNARNSVRGYPLFQNIRILANLLRQEVAISLREEAKQGKEPAEVADIQEYWNKLNGAAPTKVISFGGDE